MLKTNENERSCRKWPRQEVKLQESVKKRKEVKDWEDGHPKMSPNQLSRKEKIQMKLAE